MLSTGYVFFIKRRPPKLALTYTPFPDPTVFRCRREAVIDERIGRWRQHILLGASLQHRRGDVRMKGGGGRGRVGKLALQERGEQPPVGDRHLRRPALLRR